MSDIEVKGIITDIDIGYGRKYKDPDNIFTKCEVQLFNGQQCVQLFGQEGVNKILNQLKRKVRYDATLDYLLHLQIHFLIDEMEPGMPKALKVWRDSEWIYNNNWD